MPSLLAGCPRSWQDNGMVRPFHFIGLVGQNEVFSFTRKERTMDKITRIGIDLGKRVFHVTALDATDEVVERKRFGRAELRAYLAKLPVPCEVALEACGSAHHWGRVAQGLGHTVRLMSPQFVLPYVKSNKNDVQRRRCDRRGGGPSLDAICGGQGGGFAASSAVASCAAVGGQGPHRARQPDSWICAGVWGGLAEGTECDAPAS